VIVVRDNVALRCQIISNHLGPWAHNLRICKTKGVRTFGSTAAEIVCRGATLNTLSSFGFNCVYYALRVEG